MKQPTQTFKMQQHNYEYQQQPLSYVGIINDLPKVE